MRTLHDKTLLNISYHKTLKLPQKIKIVFLGKMYLTLEDGLDLIFRVILVLRT